MIILEFMACAVLGVICKELELRGWLPRFGGLALGLLLMFAYLRFLRFPQ